MPDIINVYCDESCHLENDKQTVMVLGAVWCSDQKKKETAQRIYEIKRKHHMDSNFEFKWTKVGPSKVALYMDLVDYFFDDDDLKFRCLVVSDKDKLNHERFGQNHDEWYYKMYFNMLKVLLRPEDSYQIYLDIKDTKSSQKVKKLHDVLCNNAYDFSRSMIRKVQHVRSHEIAHIQLADILTGAMVYSFRDKRENSGKKDIVSRILKRSAKAHSTRKKNSTYLFGMLRIIKMSDWLPDIVSLNANGGDWGRYVEAIYAVFARDFVGVNIAFTGRNVRLKRHPMEDGKEATFWHIISEGPVEEDRLPDLRRCERIGWPRAIIDNGPGTCFKMWTESVKGEPRIHLWCEDESYLFVLADRGDYVLPWTAYCVQYENQKRKLNKRWEANKEPEQN